MAAPGEAVGTLDLGKGFAEGSGHSLLMVVNLITETSAESRRSFPRDFRDNAVAKARLRVVEFTQMTSC